jgi:lipopolysaccharide export system protein LptA
MSVRDQKPRAALAILAATAILVAIPVAAQSSDNAVADQIVIPDQKIDVSARIEAAALEVLDRTGTATFSGNVSVMEGELAIKCPNLVVYFGQKVGSDDTPTATPTRAASGAPKYMQNIRRMEMRGGVTVVTKDQNTRGDLGIYDPQTKTITLSGNVTAKSRTGDQ